MSKGFEQTLYKRKHEWSLYAWKVSHTSLGKWKWKSQRDKFPHLLEGQQSTKDNVNCWQGCGGTRTCVYYWWKWKW